MFSKIGAAASGLKSLMSCMGLICRHFWLVSRWEWGNIDHHAVMKQVKIVRLIAQICIFWTCSISTQWFNLSFYERFPGQAILIGIAWATERLRYETFFLVIGAPVSKLECLP